jgi:hypothetical protein
VSFGIEIYNDSGGLLLDGNSRIMSFYAYGVATVYSDPLWVAVPGMTDDGSFAVVSVQGVQEAFGIGWNPVSFEPGNGGFTAHPPSTRNSPSLTFHYAVVRR